MIIIAKINGSGQIVNYALSIMGWFSIIFPAKLVTCSTITFHTLELRTQ